MAIPVGHDRNKGVQTVVTKFSERVLPGCAALQQLDIVGRTGKETIGDARGNQHTSQETQGLVTMHPHSLLTLGSFLRLENGAHASVGL